MVINSYNKFILKESNGGIDSICKKYKIYNYIINKDGSIDGDGDVNLFRKNLDKIPLKFNKVSGSFDCSDNRLISLEGCPKWVDGDFDCYDNKLTSLKKCPEYIGGYFDCSGNILTSFEGFPEDYEGHLYIESNPTDEIFDLFPTESMNKCIYWINEFDVIRDGNKISLDRLEEVFIQMNLKVPENIKSKNYEII